MRLCTKVFFTTYAKKHWLRKSYLWERSLWFVGWSNGSLNICSLQSWIMKLEPDRSYRVDYSTLYNGEMRVVVVRAVTSHQLTHTRWRQRAGAAARRRVMRGSSSKHHCPYSETKPRPLSVMVGRSPLIYCKSINQSCISTDLSSCLSRFFPNHSLLFCSHRFCFSYLLRSLKATLRVQFFPIVGIVSCAHYCPWGREFVSNAVLRNWWP